MRLIEINRETVRLSDGAVEQSARVLPRLVRDLSERGESLAVGDWVHARPEGGELWLYERVEPRTRLARRDGDGRRHALVHNVDTVLIVMGLDGDYNPRRLERFAALIEAELAPRVVLTKADACADAAARVAALERRLVRPIPIVALDARDAAAVVAEVGPWLAPGRTGVMLGSSGAGKSTLTNALVGDAVQDTGGQRGGDDRGRHTTTRRTLFRLPNGACLIDTPGVRALRPDGDEGVLAAGFADIATLAPACRFRDCRHAGEPGCAVRGTVDDDRLANFQKLQRELRRDAMTPLDRRAQLSEWKARSRAARERLRDKREGRE